MHIVHNYELSKILKINLRSLKELTIFFIRNSFYFKFGRCFCQGRL
jgi:hypothetical protein